jgi:hypothetical protein
MDATPLPFELPLPARLRPFEYLPEVDCFVATPLFEQVIRYLGLMEWTPAVWMGRYFALDNDYGEHWFDNWAEREAIRFHPVVNARGLDETELFIIAPERHSNGQDGPCHPPELRKMFWTEVLKSVELSLDFLIAEARFTKQDIEKAAETPYRGQGQLTREEFLNEIDNYIPDLESRIAMLASNTSLLD